MYTRLRRPAAKRCGVDVVYATTNDDDDDDVDEDTKEVDVGWMMLIMLLPVSGTELWQSLRAVVACATQHITCMFTYALLFARVFRWVCNAVVLCIVCCASPKQDDVHRSTHVRKVSKHRSVALRNHTAGGRQITTRCAETPAR